MTIPYPDDPSMVARATATALVLKADPGARAANPYYWHRAEPLLAAVLDSIFTSGDPDLPGAAEKLLADPASVEAWQLVCRLVAALPGAPAASADPGAADDPDTPAAPGAADDPDTPADPAAPDTPADPGAADGPAGPATGGYPALARAVWEVSTRSRLDYHIGAGYDRHARPGQDWRDWPGRTRQPGADPMVQVVIPFRDRSPDGPRARNLIACLAALGDQSAPRGDYRVTVVESDDTPRWQELTARHADEYVFAPKADLFNKCWAVNVGVVNTARPAPVICVLDADALVDHDFIRRNAERFQRRGTGGFLPFRDLTYLDEAASARAVLERCVHARPQASPERLRGFLVHRAPGVCVWLRRDVFEAINGMDERFEGWGREDLDFVLRAQLATAFDQYDDQMLHLHHPSSAQLVDGQTINAHIPLLSWSPSGPIGRIDRFQPAP